MDIQNVRYNVNGDIEATIDGIQHTIPISESNRHYQLIMAWAKDENNKIEEYTPPPPPVPAEISRRQFFQQLAVLELITEEEALAAMQSGTIPAPLAAIIDTLPEENQFEAKMLVVGATTFNINHPLSEVVRAAMEWTPEQKDNFWIEASKI